MKILFVEDQKELRDILEKRLKKEYSMDSCGDGETALDFLSVYSYDLVLLDIMLPKMDGISVLKWMRRRKISTPVLLLTAKSDIKDRVLGLDSGADDYLVKPFSYDELLARIRVLVRRNTNHLTSVLRVGDLEIDTVNKTV
ncbi:MAG TPA: response regulator, partial [Candidatus Choladousia intestinigallinarum]|nr:response regulator [Candidatus Choladousia intestinigallinarum]